MQQGRARPHGTAGAAYLVLPTTLLTEIEGDAMRLLLGAEQVDVERQEELPCPCGSGPPAGNEGAGPEVGCPLGLLELWGDRRVCVYVNFHIEGLAPQCIFSQNSWKH